MYEPAVRRFVFDAGDHADDVLGRPAKPGIIGLGDLHFIIYRICPCAVLRRVDDFIAHGEVFYKSEIRRCAPVMVE